jgi:hypothetical protein
VPFAEGHRIDQPRLLMDTRRRAAAWLARWIAEAPRSDEPQRAPVQMES